ncbi:MAG: S41 family peptidase [Bacteroidia bacterium]
MNKKLSFFAFALCLNLSILWAQENNFQSKNLSSQQVENLSAFAKMYGYIRHFQPVEQFDSLNWEKFIVTESEFAAAAKNTADLQIRLDSICLEIGKDIWVCNKEMCVTRTTVHNNLVRGLKPKATYFLYQLQTGWGNKGMNTVRPDMIYKNMIYSVHTGIPLRKEILKPDDFIRLPLTRELELCLPLTLYADENGSLSHPHEYPKYKITAKNYSSSNPYMRIGCIMIAWNVIEHYYPYLKVMKIDWEKVLPEYIQRAAQCKSEEEFKQVLDEFTVEYRDAHAWVTRIQAPDSQPYFAPPLLLDFVEEKAIVTFVDTSRISGLNLGDEILSIDRVPVKKVIAEKTKRESGATPQLIHHAVMQALFTGKKNSEIVVEIKTKDKPVFVSLKRNINIYSEHLTENRSAPFWEFEKNYFYADITRLNDSMMRTVSSKLFSAKGIIFDLRGYPGQIYIKDSVPSYLANDTVLGAKFITNIMYYPDQKNIIDTKKVQWKFVPSSAGFCKNVVFVIDGKAVSYSESVLSIYSYNKLAKLVGETTAGTNGNVNTFKLFDLYRITFTGMNVINQDDSQFHGIGIKPDIEMKRTAKALMEGRDEFLEKAIEVVKGK